MGWGTTNLDTVFDWGSGWWDAWSLDGHNEPAGTTHFTGFNSLHHTGASGTSRHGWQMTMGAGNTSLLFVRGVWGGGFTGWATVYTSSNLSLATLGYTGATNANYITNNNQLTNGSGYVTSSGVTSVATGGGLTGGTITSTGTLSHADTSSQASLTALTGANVVSDIDLDTYGHVTSMATRTMTLANLGYTGATNANYITNNNQLTNGAGYVTSSGVTSVATGGGLTGGTITTTGTLSHADTSSQGNVDNSGNYFIQDLTFDTYGHVTGVTSAEASGGGGGGGISQGKAIAIAMVFG